MTWWRHADPREGHPADPDLEQVDVTSNSEAVLSVCRTCQQVVLLTNPRPLPLP